MVEFDCCECGVHVVDICMDEPREPPLCMTCIIAPSWFEDKRLREVLGQVERAVNGFKYEPDSDEEQ